MMPLDRTGRLLRSRLQSPPPPSCERPVRPGDLTGMLMVILATLIALLVVTA